MEIRILDADPIKAAHSLIRQHVIATLRVLRFSFAACHNPYLRTQYRHRYVPILKYSVENYVWFSEFYDELMEICDSKGNVIKEFDESLLYDCSGIKFKHSGLNLFPDSKQSLTDVLAASRVAYLKKGYDTLLFPAGIPEWYVDLNKVIYEKYDSKLDKGFRVAQTKKGLKYYTAEYFNQWIEILNVPKEMEDLIKHLVYRK
jgi:hypothetical protein